MQEFEGEEVDKLGSVVSGAVITSNGKLTRNFQYIQSLRESNASIKGDFSGVGRKVNQLAVIMLNSAKLSLSLRGLGPGRWPRGLPRAGVPDTR
jgi:hypothetical protein